MLGFPERRLGEEVNITQKFRPECSQQEVISAPKFLLNDRENLSRERPCILQEALNCRLGSLHVCSHVQGSHGKDLILHFIVLSLDMLVSKQSK